jgi:hypothetical protein
MDPEVKLSAEQRVAYNAKAMELHNAQNAGATAAAPLAAMAAGVRAAAAKIDSTPTLPDSVKTQFAAFRKEYDAVRAKFGVGVVAAPGGFGGGGGGAGAGVDANVLARVGTAKSNMLAVWETPSDALVKQAAAAKTALDAAVAEANAFVAKARAMSALLAANGVTMALGPAN